jgi:hypothetical protein
MSWPPQVGDLLQRRTEPLGIEDKLRTYSLVHDHEVGGPKANGFLIMLGIDLESIDYLIAEIEGESHTLQFQRWSQRKRARSAARSSFE